MEELKYTSTKIFTRNKQGELIEKRVKAAQVCPGLLVTPEKSGMVDLIIEYNGIKWCEQSCGVSIALPMRIKSIPAVLKGVEKGYMATMDDFHKEMHRRIFNPDAPAVMELKKPERKPTQPKMNIDGTIRAKVLQYKADGNTLTEKWETLTKFSEGIYYAKDTDDYGQNHAYFIFERNGLYWQSMRSDRLERIAERREDIKADYTNFESSILAAANENRFIGKLQIEVMKRIGHDIAPLLASREAYLKQREEDERQKAEEAQRREMERKEAEERHNAEELAKGKQNFMEHKAVTAKQIELLAESVGYKINIRTIGFMREKVTEAALMEDGRVTVWGHKLTSRNIDGTAKVLTEIAERMKAQVEEEAQHTARITETPQISTETAKLENDSVEDETTAETANLRPIHVCDIQSDETWSKEEVTDICNYISWLGSYDQDCGKHNHYFTIAEKALTESFCNMLDAAYRKGAGHFLTKNKDGILIETVIESRASQHAETPPAKDCNADTEKTSQNANKPQKPTLKKSLHVRNLRTTGGVSFSRIHENDCRGSRVSQESNEVFHDKCSTASVPRMFSECSTGLPP